MATRAPRTIAGYGSVTMVALCFANLLQNGESQSFSQAADSLKHAFHVSDFALGTIPFFMGMGGAFGGLVVGVLAARYRRTAVLAVMFAAWTVLMAGNGLARSLTLPIINVGVGGFAVFYAFRLVVSTTEATDPAALPLLADYWPVDQRAGKVSVFNAIAGVGTLAGLAAGGLLVDHFGWRWAFLFWVPIGIVATALMRTRAEPVRGAQDAAFREELAELSPEAGQVEAEEEDLVARMVAGTAPAAELASTPPILLDPSTASRWQVFRYVFRLRSWRTLALAIGVGQIMQNGLMFWGTPYFKRTFLLTGTQVAELAPVLGLGSFVGLLGGGFLADRLLRRGVLLARVYVSGIGFIVAGGFLVAAFSSRSLAVAAPLLAVGSGFGTLYVGPGYAALLDVTPTPLRSQAQSVANVIMFCSALGYVLVGGLSTLFDDNLRLALMCASPVYAIGGIIVLVARRTYVTDVALVVAEARYLADHEASVDPSAGH